MRYFECEIAVQPNRGADCSRAETYKDPGRTDEALASYEATVAINPGLAEAHYGRGLVLRQSARLDVAIATYDPIIEIPPDHFDAVVHRASSLYQFGKHTEALAASVRALALRPDHTPAHVRPRRRSADDFLTETRLEASMHVSDRSEFDPLAGQVTVGCRERLSSIASVHFHGDQRLAVPARFGAGTGSNQGDGPEEPAIQPIIRHAPIYLQPRSCPYNDPSSLPGRPTTGSYPAMTTALEWHDAAILRASLNGDNMIASRSATAISLGDSSDLGFNVAPQYVGSPPR